MATSGLSAAPSCATIAMRVSRQKAPHIQQRARSSLGIIEQAPISPLQICKSLKCMYQDRWHGASMLRSHRHRCSNEDAHPGWMLKAARQRNGKLVKFDNVEAQECAAAHRVWRDPQPLGGPVFEGVLGGVGERGDQARVAAHVRHQPQLHLRVVRRQQHSPSRRHKSLPAHSGRLFSIQHL